MEIQEYPTQAWTFLGPNRSPSPLIKCRVDTSTTYTKHSYLLKEDKERHTPALSPLSPFSLSSLSSPPIRCRYEQRTLSSSTPLEMANTGCPQMNMYVYFSQIVALTDIPLNDSAYDIVASLTLSRANIRPPYCSTNTNMRLAR